ncbi:hypothetical protein C3B51_22190 [Pseudoalteromonas rubra]|uniref:CENP-V/GFA domain-containing protein n=1 Tax=Pseudoalteromonas rubra TaxID=43658 RepID=A0A4Q7DZG1_9GAMM|nr:DUF6151 family protein [Pseudoalteromonas rubra]RZM71917.1 hypothetical protein C3B51_22190 [Pseudoalteromonas rubra]
MVEGMKLECRCGQVRGRIAAHPHWQGNRLTCYCKDCRAYLQHLERADCLNEFGGTDIYQVPPAHVTISQGQAQLACLQLTQRGVYRFYTQCCNTPVGNCFSAFWPMVGIVGSFVLGPLDEQVGPSEGSVYCRDALGRVPDELKGTRSHKAMVLRLIAKLLAWKLCGKNSPSVFFVNGEPCVVPQLLAPGSAADKG